jgi:hypothetical protein
MEWQVILFAVLVAVAIIAWVWFMFYADGEAHPPPIEPQESIAEAAARERLELHNASLDYAELQGPKDRHTVVMLAAAFRMGAKWQQRRP